jgi:hypothetical protein
MSYDFGAADKDYAGLIAAVKVRNTANHRDAMCESDFCYRGQGRNVTPSLKYCWWSHQEYRYLRRSARWLARFLSDMPYPQNQDLLTSARASARVMPISRS